MCCQGSWGIAQGLCCSLGNNTQASSLMNSGSLHKSCWKVLSVPAGLEPLAAPCAGAQCSAREVAQPMGDSWEARYLPPGGEAEGGFALPTWPEFDLDFDCSCSLVLFFLGPFFFKEMQ